MRSGLFWKLFLLQMIAAMAVIAGALFVTRWYSMRGFAEHLETRERANVQILATELAQAYRNAPDLKAAAASVPALRRRLAMRGHACAGPDCPPARQGPGLTRRFERAPEGPAETAPERFPPAPSDVPDFLLPRSPEDGEPNVLRLRRERGEFGLVLSFNAPFMPPLQLQDADGRYVIGVRVPGRDSDLREPVVVDDLVVGYLAWPRFPGYPEEAEFARKQGRHLGVIAPVALVVAALFAMLITALVVRPIRRLSEGTAALARREFAMRVPAGRRDEIGQLARDFNRLAQALEGYDMRQRQWLADIAHELRTPVSVLRGELEAVLDGVRRPDTDTVQSLRQEVTRIEKLIEDLHLVSLAESGGLQLHREPMDVSLLVTAALTRFRKRFVARGFDVQPQIQRGLIAPVDAQRMEQMLANLLENVLKHAMPPGPVIVGASMDLGQIVITVADAGPGVPDEALARLFDRLYRVESSRARASGGAGLGLSICKSIVEAHGGTIFARPTAAGGLEIVVRIPIAPRA